MLHPSSTLSKYYLTVGNLGTLRRRACWPLRYQNYNNKVIMEITVLELTERYTLLPQYFCVAIWYIVV